MYSLFRNDLCLQGILDIASTCVSSHIAAADSPYFIKVLYFLVPFRALRSLQLHGIRLLLKSPLQGMGSVTESITAYEPRKCAFGHAWTAKTQIRLRIRAVWSGPSLTAARLIGYYRSYQWRAKAWMRPFACAGWCEFALTRRHFFAWRGT